jgi:hypothetical protein
LNFSIFCKLFDILKVLLYLQIKERMYFVCFLLFSTFFISKDSLFH